jgi:hypothetical protein
MNLSISHDADLGVCDQCMFLSAPDWSVGHCLLFDQILDARGGTYAQCEKCKLVTAP